MSGSDGAKRILVVHRYYWPDTAPYATMLHTIASRWVEDGHSVAALSSLPSYRASTEISADKMATIDGVTVTRLDLPAETGRPILRLWNAVRLIAAITMRLLSNRRPHLVMMSTAPPVVGAFFASIIAKWRGVKFVYHVMDIHPEIGAISGEFSNPLIFRLLRWMDSSTCLRSDTVVVLSHDMADSLRARGGRMAFAQNIEVLNNFALCGEENIAVCAESEIAKSAGALRIVFAGNIGRFQGLESLIDAVSMTSNNSVELIMLGDGVEKERLERRAAELRASVRFLGQRSVSEARQYMASADFCYVALVDGVIRYAYPSKVLTYLAEGAPLLIRVDPGSELAKNARSKNFGVVIEDDSPEAISRLLCDLATNPEGIEAMRRSAKDYGAQFCTKESVLPRWTQLLSNLSGKSRRGVA